MFSLSSQVVGTSEVELAQDSYQPHRIFHGDKMIALDNFKQDEFKDSSRRNILPLLMGSAGISVTSEPAIDALLNSDAAGEASLDKRILHPLNSRGKRSQIRYKILSEDEYGSRLEAENYDKDPRSQLHFVKYMKTDGKTFKVWECGICSKEFRHQYTLMRHLPTHTDERNFKCETCGKGFRQMSTLSQHRAIHSDARPYVCEQCKKTFNRVSTLISHRKTHSDNKPHKCQVCGKGFHQKGNLRNHVFTHTNERPYKCEYCGKGFNQMSNLMCHKVKTHAHGEKIHYVCNICNLEFPRRYALKMHEEYNHNLKHIDGVKILPALNIKHISNNYAIDVVQMLNQDGSLSQNVSNFFHQSTTLNQSSMLTNISGSQSSESSSGVLIEPITTKAMMIARQTGQIPFALLKLLKGTQLLMKVLIPSEHKHILVPANAEDLKNLEEMIMYQNIKNVSSTKALHIKVPIVATIVQRLDSQGRFSFDIDSPPNDNEITTAYANHFENSILSQRNATLNLQLNGTSASLEYINESKHLLKEVDIMGDTSENFMSYAESKTENSLSLLQPKQTEDLIDFSSETIQFICPTVNGSYNVLSENTQIIQGSNQSFEDLANEHGLQTSIVDEASFSEIVEVINSAGFELPSTHETVIHTDSDQREVNVNEHLAYAEQEVVLP